LNNNENGAAPVPPFLRQSQSNKAMKGDNLLVSNENIGLHCLVDPYITNKLSH